MFSETYLQKHIWPRFWRVIGRQEIYLANHSLGRPLDQTALDVQGGLDLWYGQMDDGWQPWLAEMNLWRSNVARLIGLSRPDGIVPKTSAGQGLRAVLNAFPQDRPVRVVTTRGEFDSVDFILKTYHQAGRADVSWVEPAASEGPVPIYTVDSIIDKLSGKESGINSAVPGPASVGLVVVSLVFFGTGQILQDVEKLVEAAHAKGWAVLLDLYHAAGVIPLDFDAIGADFGIGGSYKYLRGGPGACWLALGRRISTPLPPSSGSREESSVAEEDPRREKTEEGGFRTLDTGWFAKKETFGYERSDEAQVADGGDGWLESTPPILMPYQAKAGLDFTLELGVDSLRSHSLEQQALMRRIFRKRGVELFEPAAPDRFGAFSLMHHSDASQVSQRLKVAGVNTDARGDFVRFGPDILNTEEEFERAAGIVSATA